MVSIDFIHVVVWERSSVYQRLVIVGLSHLGVVISACQIYEKMRIIRKVSLRETKILYFREG